MHPVTGLEHMLLFSISGKFARYIEKNTKEVSRGRFLVTQ